MQKKGIFFAGAIVCVVVAGWGYYQYQKPRQNASKMPAAFSVSATQLYTEYSTDETGADEKYGGKVLQVQGVVADVQTTPQSTNILLVGSTEAGGVNCSLQTGVPAMVDVGDAIQVKGKCTGFLMDVSLVDAVLIRK